MVYVFLVLLGVLAVLGLIGLSMYNNLVSLKAYVDEAWSGIDVQLKRRYDLIPNLVAVVKQYSVHEQGTLEKVTQLRASAMGAQTVSAQVAAENQLAGALKTLFAVSENYPDLKASESFIRLHDQLAQLEHDIQLGRRYYNGAARNYNIAVARFPSTIIAGLAHFMKVPYFEVAAAERENPTVKF